MDKFPECFRRSEQDIDYSEAEDFDQFRMMFAEWAGHNWKDSPKQRQALHREWLPYQAKMLERALGREQAKIYTKYLTKGQQFSAKYGNYQAWYVQKPRATAYMIRIERYMAKHPNATLAEARGHKKR